MDKIQLASLVGITIESYLINHDQTTVVRNNHTFTLNKFPGGSIYLEASQGILVDLNLNFSE
jgi:hypothetical protein